MAYAEKTGTRVVINEFGDVPLTAVEQHLHIEPQPPPDPAGLGADDVVIAVPVGTTVTSQSAGTSNVIRPMSTVTVNGLSL